MAYSAYHKINEYTANDNPKRVPPIRSDIQCSPSEMRETNMTIYIPPKHPDSPHLTDFAKVLFQIIKANIASKKLALPICPDGYEK